MDTLDDVDTDDDVDTELEVDTLKSKKIAIFKTKSITATKYDSFVKSSGVTMIYGLVLL